MISELLKTKHTAKDVLVAAYLTGHAWNPAYPNLQNLDMGRVLKMSGEEADAKELVRSWQQFDANYDLLVQAYHRRFPDYDGIVGPSTLALADLSRCPIPDYAPPPGASFDYGDPDLNAAVKSYQDWAEAGESPRGSGSWPVGCDPQKPDYHSVVIQIDTTAASANQKAILDEVLKMVEETEAEMGQSVRHVVNQPRVEAQHDVKFQYIAGGVIGFAYFPTPNTCNQRVNARIDNSFNARPTVLAELLTHEYKGHSDGLQHTRGGIMNPSIGSPTQRPTWRADPHEKTKTKYFGGKPLPTTPVPPGPNPPGPTPPGNPYLKKPLIITDADGKRYGVVELIEV